MSYSVERVAESKVLGEGPHWDAKTQTLYFVDILGSTIHKYKPSTNEHVTASIETSPSFIIPVEGTTNKFVVGLLRYLAIVTWDGVSNTISDIEKVAEVDVAENLSNNRLNDGKTDPSGTLWAGSMSNSGSLKSNFPRDGRLYSFNKNRQLKGHLDDIQIANGLAWDEGLKKFYYIDSMKRTIDQFDYDAENESISNRKSIFSLDKHNIPGFPDGQTIDADGNLWVAIFTGSRVIKINPRIPETLLQTIELPAKQVTSVAFGGQNLDELYVTTARAVLENNEPLTSADGATYRVTGLGVRGLPGVPFKF